MASKATLAERGETIRAEREAAFKTPVFPEHDEPLPRGEAMALNGHDPASMELGRATWAIYQVAQRLREVGIIGNRDRRTGKRLDFWSVDIATRTIHVITPDLEVPIEFDEREQQTLMIGYIVASLQVDCPRAFEGVTVEIDRIAAEVRLVEATC